MCVCVCVCVCWEGLTTWWFCQPIHHLFFFFFFSSSSSSRLFHLDMALGAFGLSREDAFVHLLNFVWPNIYETSPHLINAVLEAIEGLRVVLGPTKILQYTLQGLYHPARVVRQVYWKIYNTLYIASQAALVPAYPRIDNDATNSYRRWEMECFL